MNCKSPVSPVLSSLFKLRLGDWRQSPESPRSGVASPGPGESRGLLVFVFTLHVIDQL
uniref:Uncharacterized protein n=1 Tax=Anguilla anguilla TaxID=7936 RepID=A0A0E9XNS0_ANGAN